MWRDNDVRTHGEAVKRLRHPVLGHIEFEYSAFAVDGRPDLSMVVYNPTNRKTSRKSARSSASEINRRWQGCRAAFTRLRRG